MSDDDSNLLYHLRMLKIIVKNLKTQYQCQEIKQIPENTKIHRILD
jgi:hypothetical protein